MRLLAAVLAYLLIAAAPAAATVLIPADLGDLARDARVVARGRIIAVESRWASEFHGIETIVTLAVETWLKGDLGATVQFRIPGGRAGRYRTVFVGAPSFDAGDRVIVFLGSSGPSFPYVLGLSQGVYRVVAAPDGRAVVTPPALLPVRSDTAVVRGDGARRPLPLADFEQTVRQLAAGGGR